MILMKDFPTHLLHLEAELRGGGGAVGVAQLVQVGHRLLARVLPDGPDGFARPVLRDDGVGARSPKHHQVQQRVGAEAVSAVHWRAGSLARRVQAGDNLCGDTTIVIYDI